MELSGEKRKRIIITACLTWSRKNVLKENYEAEIRKLKTHIRRIQERNGRSILSTINECTYDKSPYACKSFEMIKERLEKTVAIVDITKSKYNLKGSD